ncbi:MAG: hypothetical protein M1616_01325 [Candidatus Thermoplasmatota archaeon]|nr:hypothetical protein [Candidatus Thermoplasmatota archaeon]
MYYFLRFGYEGYNFSGFQRGNGVHSVEDTIMGCIRKHGLASDISCAARTDRNVSATGNVMKISSEEPAEKIAGILNSQCEGIFITAYAEVDGDANPRHCLRKTYSYFLRNVGDIGLLKSQLSMFQGMHDFHMFCRVDSRNPVRTIERIDVTETGGKSVRIDFTARSFVWMQIRNIVGFCTEAASSGKIVDPFQITGWSRKPASPYPLVLTDVSYPDLHFRWVRAGSKKRHYVRAGNETWAKLMILNQITSDLGSSDRYS